MTKIYNRASEKQLRQVLRRNTPKAESLLWARLRRKQVLGLRFHRQFSVGPYSIDFYCPALKLAIEIDGDSHFSQNAMVCDRDRQEYIEAFGIRFLRFTNNQIFENSDGVIELITQTALSLNGELATSMQPFKEN